jgi:hypothetical protein
MIEEYENWEDSIRHTFIEMANHMNPNATPIDAIIDFALKSGANLFIVNNAKDELKKLREEVDNLRNQLDKPVAWARINKRGDMFDLRLLSNPYNDPKTVVPLYALRKGIENET